jgi:stearoyl-CoA desaturase (delta-9 desaturase)
MLALHLGAAAAPFMFSWPAAAIGFATYWIAGGIGIGIGYHRLLTHRSYAVAWPVEYLVTLCGSLALQGGPVWWVATHRLHHAHADRENDPHSPRHGRWWSHMGWILHGYSLRHDPEVGLRYAPELAADRFHRWLNRLHLLPPTLFGLVLYGAGGWPYLLWGLCLGGVVLLHSTWLVNSAAHIWGRRRFETRDDSRNCWWVALLTFGEGWHNNHHAQPRSARHGLAWFEIDVNWLVIRALERLGVASALRRPVTTTSQLATPE